MQRDTCKGEHCKAEIYWFVRPTTGTRRQLIPLNTQKLTIVDKDGNYHVGYVPHHATCPDVKAINAQKKAERDEAAALADANREMGIDPLAGRDVGNK